MPGKTARALCPVCQEPMPPDETECENCGAFVIDEAVVRLCRALGIPRDKALALFEKGFRHPKQLQDRDVDDVLKKGENGLLFLCTNCGGFVATGDAKCPRCGAEFEGEEEPERVPERDILDTTLCPVCGADNDAEWKECEICGEPLGGTEEPPGEPAPPTAPPADQPARSSVATQPTAVPPSVPSPLDAIDDILEDLEQPANPGKNAGIRRVAKVARIHRKVQRDRPPTPPTVPPAESAMVAEPQTAPTSAPLRPVVRTRKPPLRPIHRPAPPPERKVPDLRRTPPIRRPPWAATPSRVRREAAPLPSELVGGLTVASAATLYLSVLLRQTLVAWGVALVAGALVALILIRPLRERSLQIDRADALALLGGATLCSIAPAFHATFAPVASVAGAVAIAFATRHLLTSHGRHLIVAASGMPLVALGVVAGLGFPFALSPAWAFGVAATVPWPAAVAMEGIRQRRTSLLLGRELTKAEEHMERQDYTASVRDFDRAIAVSGKGVPGGETPWYGKGASLILLGRYEEALLAIDKALDLNPRNEVAWLNKGNALSKMGRMIDALRCFNAAIKVNPRYEVAWNNKGNTLARLGHFEEALTCYDRAIEIDSGYRGAWVNKGYVLTKLGRYDEATSCADRALRLNDRVRTGAA